MALALVLALFSGAWCGRTLLYLASKYGSIQKLVVVHSYMQCCQQPIFTQNVLGLLMGCLSYWQYCINDVKGRKDSWGKADGTWTRRMLANIKNRRAFASLSNCDSLLVTRGRLKPLDQVRNSDLPLRSIQPVLNDDKHICLA